MFSNNMYDPFSFDGSFNLRDGNPFSSEYGNRRRHDLARRQRIMEGEHRRKAEYERRKRAEEEMAMKEQLRREMLQRERLKMEQTRRQRSTKKQPSQNSPSYAPGTVVLGQDGNLYRVVAPPRRERCDVFEDRSDACFESSSSADKENEDEDVFSKKCDVAKDELMDHDSDSFQEGRHYMDIDDDSQMKSQIYVGQSDKSPVIAPSAHAPLHEILVENVPDDEDEELREMRSVWRTRIPSPGQWMEPVESFSEK